MRKPMVATWAFVFGPVHINTIALNAFEKCSHRRKWIVTIDFGDVRWTAAVPPSGERGFRIRAPDGDERAAGDPEATTAEPAEPPDADADAEAESAGADASAGNSESSSVGSVEEASSASSSAS